MAPTNRWEELLEQLRTVLEREHCEPALEALPGGYDPADITLAMEELETNQAQRVFAALKLDCAAQVLCMTGPALTRELANRFDAPALSSSGHLRAL